MKRDDSRWDYVSLAKPLRLCYKPILNSVIAADNLSILLPNRFKKAASFFSSNCFAVRTPLHKSTP